MNAPIRWKERQSEVSDELRALMQHASTRAPTEAQLASLTAAVVEQLGPSAAVGSASTFAGVSAGKLLVVSLLVAGAVAVTGWQYLAPALTPTPSPSQPAHAAPAVHAPAPLVAPSLPEAPSVTEEPPTHPIPESAPASPAPRKAKHSTRSAIARSADDVALLHDARKARSRAPELALGLLGEHERRYPNSAFSEEREAMRIEIWRRVDPPEAERRLRAFVARFPSSTYRFSPDGASRSAGD